MKVIFYSVKLFEIEAINNANTNNYKLSLFADQLNIQTADLARGHDAVCVFTSDDLSAPVLIKLKQIGINFINLRATGYDKIDLIKAEQLGITITNVPSYSPNGIAEHTIMLLLSLLKKNKITQHQIDEHNFSLDKIIGSNLQGKVIGIIGTGKIGSAMARLLHGFDVKLIAFDMKTNEELIKKYNLAYTTLESLCKQSDIITIHLPLNQQTKYMINDKILGLIKYNAIIINTSRGAIVKTIDLLKHLRNKHIGGYGMDVYENENGIFFFDHSKKHIEDKMLLELIAMDNVMITPHQAFATEEAVLNITKTTFHNFYAWETNKISGNEITTVMIEKNKKQLTA